MRRSRGILLAGAAFAALAVYLGWIVSALTPDPDGSDTERAPRTADPAAGDRDRIQLSRNDRVVRPGSMEEALLDTTDGNRRTMISQTLRDRGFECPEVVNAAPLGNDGIVWRANCGQARVYWVSVGKNGRLSVEPAPYGDVSPPFGTPAIPAGRTIELRESE